MYSASLFGVIVRVANDEALTEDVLQDTFLKIWNSFSRYSSEKGRHFTWMVNLAIDKIRSRDFKNQPQNRALEYNVAFID